MTTNTAKHQVRELIDRLPDDCTWDQIVSRISLEAKLHRAESDIAAGRVRTQMEVERESSEWLKSAGPTGQ